MNKRKLGKILLAFLIVGCFSIVSSIEKVEYYYSPDCPHCQKVSPLIYKLAGIYPLDWYLYDVTKKSYDIQSVPTIVIDDNIKLVGSAEIPKYIECYLNEQSNLNCPTYPANECRNDWFIR